MMQRGNSFKSTGLLLRWSSRLLLRVQVGEQPVAPDTKTIDWCIYRDVEEGENVHLVKNLWRSVERIPSVVFRTPALVLPWTLVH